MKELLKDLKQLNSDATELNNLIDNCENKRK